jgi:hypothetical protein
MLLTTCPWLWADVYMWEYSCCLSVIGASIRIRALGMWWGSMNAMGFQVGLYSTVSPVSVHRQVVRGE